MNGADSPSNLHAETAQPPGGFGSNPRAISLALSGVLAAAFAAAAYGRRWICDDAFINLRVVEMVRLGHGPVFNPGERIEVATSPLWLTLQVLWSALLGDPATGSLVLGLLFATAAMLLLAMPPNAPRDRVVVPAGALVFAALPVAWDFATSGLETGLVLFWLATAWRAALRLQGASAPWSATNVALLAWIGLGPLVRPEAAIPAALLLGSVLLPVLRTLAPTRAKVRRVAGYAAVAGALPVGVVIARAGYFGSLVSNPSVAKGLGAPDIAGGLDYVWDLLITYQLALGVAALSVLALVSRGGAKRSVPLPTLALLLGGLAWAAVVVRVGGDFMHGRMLLPPLFALLLPVGALPLPAAGAAQGARTAFALAASVLLGWAVWTAVALRPTVQDGPPIGVVDERTFYLRLAERPNPVSLESYRGSPYHNYGLAVREAAAEHFAPNSGHSVVLTTPRAAMRGREAMNGPAAAEWIPQSVGVVVAVQMIGILGLAAGPHVFVYDVLGLADPLAARMPELQDGRIGHRRRASVDWYHARHAAPSESDNPDVQLLRRTLQCGELAELHEAVTAPMTPALFVRNVLRAPRLSRLQIPREPAEAHARFCGGEGAT